MFLELFLDGMFLWLEGVEFGWDESVDLVELFALLFELEELLVVLVGEGSGCEGELAVEGEVLLGEGLVLVFEFV